jgi:HAD superfamily hydrolase (TIGR01490 family)
VSSIIAFFDFDGTITTRDTLLEFIKFSKGRFRFYLGFALNSPWLVAMKLKLISNQAAKERIWTWFFRGCPEGSFQEQCNRFAADVLPSLIRPKALKEIRVLREKNATIVIVSASPVDWVGRWAGSLPAECIATRVQVAGQLLNGKILGRNCHGEEKVTRIRNAYQLSVYDHIYAYGDSTGDRPMLGLAHSAFYKPFR